MEKPHKKKAAALKYVPEKDQAPQLIAKGAGHVAERIIETARAKGIYVHEDKALVEILSKLEINQEIPPKLYEVIAEILAFVYRVESKLNKPL